MLWFNKAEKEVSITYKDLCERLANVEAKLNGLEIENKVLRDKVLRKIQYRHDEDITQNPLSSQQKSFNPFIG